MVRVIQYIQQLVSSGLYRSLVFSLIINLILFQMENNSQEVWKQIDGFEDYYQVSSEGKVRSLDRLVRNGTGSVKLMKSKVLKPQMNKNGYLLVNLWKDSKQIHYLVHRLVYEAFHGKRPEGMEINHIDEDKSNNSIKNLNLMTHKENANWGTCIERRAKKTLKANYSV